MMSGLPITRRTIFGESSPVSLRRIAPWPDGVHLTYDKMASFLAPYRNAEALTVAWDLDSKIEKLLLESV